ncbi:MAG: helix-turn-helix domain-containing protein [Clostridia bacterium]|nr:helix-turn-helix domain-containing protein [Clostridia bacterium]
MRVKLQRTRKAQGFTQLQFAEAVGLSRSHYSQIETGEKSPSLQVAIKIKRALNYQGDDIFDNTAY